MSEIAYAFEPAGRLAGIVDLCNVHVALPYFHDVGHSAHETRAFVPVSGPRGGCIVDGVLFTKRELEVLRLLPERLTYEQIARKLFVAKKTVERHVESLFLKTGLNRRHLVIEWARKRGLPGENWVFLPIA